MVFGTERFEELAWRIAESREVPDCPLVILPSDVEQRGEADLLDLGRNALSEAVEALSGTRGRE